MMNITILLCVIAAVYIIMALIVWVLILRAPLGRETTERGFEVINEHQF